MHKTNKAAVGLTLGALGVVFGDIGTNPLYALRVIFGPLGRHLAINQVSVYGIISLVFWTVTLVVSVKYVGFVMRADNKGEGGIMALVALIQSHVVRHKQLFIFLGLVGVALFYGDSAITPAISVLSAVEGLKVIAPDLGSYVLPITLIILTSLFWIQRYGTGLIGRLFGPVMLVWFATIGLGGGWQVWQHPQILHALSPLAATTFIAAQPFVAFIAMGAVVLTVTGAEALYADMGHFGRAPIARAWFLLVFPALTLCYMGQGALLLHNSQAMINPFFILFPEGLRIPVVILATAATLVASQSVISGAFSLTRQAVQLNFLPRMMIRQTSARKIGQIYIPFVNIALFIIVALLVLFFGSSEKLANAYGVAVSGTLAADTILFLVVARNLWQKSRLMVATAGGVFLTVDLILISSSLSKIPHGGWLPLAVAAVVLLLINTWSKGQSVTAQERRALEGSLQDFISQLHVGKPQVVRLPGHAVYIGHHEGHTPLALHAAVEDLHEIHEKVVIVYVQTSTAAHIPEDKRAVFNDLGFHDGISQVSLSYGFHDSPNIPQTLRSLRHLSPELNFDPYTASYFISLAKVVPTKRRHTFATWRKSLYSMMDRNALSASDYYLLPIDRTMEIRTLIKL